MRDELERIRRSEMEYCMEHPAYFIENYCPVSYTHLDVYKRQDFDWLVRDANMAKVLEGKYADDRPPSPEPDGTDAKTDWGLKDVIRC